MEASTTDQTALDERSVDDQTLRGELEKALDDLQVAKDAAKEPKRKIKTMKEVVNDKLTELGATDGEVYRIGRFRVTFKHIPGKKVEFETEDRTQSYIKQLSTDDE